jgi:predicted kinase
MNNKLIIIRGLPGSGKTTKAKQILAENPTYKHYEADMYFERDGEYVFVPSHVPDAHKWCQTATFFALSAGYTVVVSNTFTTKKEIEPYITIANNLKIPFEILTLTENYGNIHNVPQHTLNKMQNRFETVIDFN